jgi:hypothetical protein
MTRQSHFFTHESTTKDFLNLLTHTLGDSHVVAETVSKNGGVILPELTQHFQSFVDDGTLIPGWQQANHFIQGHASHVSASGLGIPKAPGLLRMAFTTNHPDEAKWRESFAKDYKGLIDYNTFDIISEETYLDSRKCMGRSAIPFMGILTVKNDSDGKPVHAKSRVVALGNKDPVEWTKAECYAPIVSRPIV